VTAPAPALAIPQLPPSALSAIQRVLARHPAVRAAVLFGSRAMGTARPGSDIDLALDGEVSVAELARIAADLDGCDLAWEVDLVRLSALEDAEVRAHVARVGVTVFRAAESPG
jgi:predicted nucleotidyltransferase